MPSRISFSLAIHNHQPVGNFPEVFAAAYQRSYLPMLDALERHPAVRVGLHYSGPLFDWLDASRPEFAPRLRALVDRGQVELLTGGYYEPILAAIPERDRQGQIQKMSAYLLDRFGVRPTGLWLAERVWEPHLARSIADAGATYTIVDDAHFLAAGMREDELTGYFVTEDEGAMLKILPSRKRLRYLIPWQPVADVLAFLRTAPDGSLLVMGDDGEKFGTWPGTYDHCWTGALRPGSGQGWIEEFFTALEAAGDWLAVIPPGEAAGGMPAGSAYLPTASYDEMMEWALPAEQAAVLAEVRHRLDDARDPAAPFVRGGFWRQFLVKYAEINTMHKRMLRTSRKVHALPADPRRARALDELWQGQCNCPYWHGVFGGVYLPHIRAANFGHLIAADALADGTRVRAEQVDTDADGVEEVEIVTPSMVLVVDPVGAAVVEWHWRAARVNLTNVLSRRPEAYHARLRDAAAAPPSGDAVETIHTARVRVKEPGLEHLLVYDWYRRASFLEHILDADVSLEAFARGTYRERGDFVNQPYAAAVTRSGGGIVARWTRDGGFWSEGARAPLRVEKELIVDPQRPRVEVAYHVQNTGPRPLALAVGIETNWAVTDPTAPVRLVGEVRSTSAPQAQAAVQRIEITDGAWPGAVTLSMPAAEVWVLPLFTVSNSEAGFERIFQGLTCLCVWRLALEPEQAWDATLVALLADKGMKG